MSPTPSSPLDIERAKDTIDQRLERLELAVQGAGLGTWNRDLVTDEVTWNRHLYELLGRDPRGPQISGETFFEYIHEDDLERVVKCVEKGYQGEDVFREEFRIVREDGQIRWLAAAGRVYRDKNGRPVQMAGVNFDITERKEAEARLRQSEERYALAQRAAEIGSWEWDILTGALTWSDMIEPLFGFSLRGLS
jgi:PAS domain S-box-containing protein